MNLLNNLLRNKTLKTSELCTCQTAHPSGHSFINFGGVQITYIFVDPANFYMPKYGHVSLVFCDSFILMPMKDSNQSKRRFTGVAVAMDLFNIPASISEGRMVLQ
jgi:hypothetical protein